MEIKHSSVVWVFVSHYWQQQVFCCSFPAVQNTMGFSSAKPWNSGRLCHNSSLFLLLQQCLTWPNFIYILKLWPYWRKLFRGSPDNESLQIVARHSSKGVCQPFIYNTMFKAGAVGEIQFCLRSCAQEALTYIAAFKASLVMGLYLSCAVIQQS